jgi:DnaJ-class molecular chaperone
VRPQIFVKRGSRAGDKITFREEGDQAPDTTPGDVIVVLQELRHPHFKRAGMDLFYQKTITLGEALCGVHCALGGPRDRARAHGLGMAQGSSSL